MEYTKIELKAYAKINLGLDVVAKLENGYHQVEMVMQTIDLADTLIIEKQDMGITIDIYDSDLSVGKDNLIYQAAELMIETYNIIGGVHIILYKKIPVAAGLAGGSTDAAATMNGINQLYQLGIDLQELQQLGLNIGADVPYCLQGGTALAEGIGEKLTPLPSVPKVYLVIAKPDIMVSTAEVYQGLQLPQLTHHIDITKMVRAIHASSLVGIINSMGNVLESVTVVKYPVINEIKSCMIENGALNALMSGSGPTVFGIYTNQEEASRAYQCILERNLATQVYKTCWKEEIHAQ